MSTQIKTIPSEELETKFDDISGLEDWREYVYKDGSIYTITNPTKIYVTRKPNGDSHRLIDAQGIRHYVPSGWVAFRFQGKWGRI